MLHNTLNVIFEKEESKLSHQHSTFNRLIKTIKDLQATQENTERDLDIALQFYLTHVKPEEEILRECKADVLIIAYQFYKNPTGLSNNELKKFAVWLTKKVNEFCANFDAHEVLAPIKEIFTDLNGFTYEEACAKEFEELRSTIQKDMQDSGINVDLSDISLEGSKSEIMQRILAKISAAKAQQKKSSRTETRKSKKQLEKELKKQQFEEMQSKNLSVIYKQLVRVLHPDLEQDVEQKARKEEVMKKLTTAFKNNDIYSLLSIEMEWMNRSPGKIASQNDQDLKLYNTILKDQIKELQTTIDMLIMHPRYTPIQSFYANRFDGVSTLERQHAFLKINIKERKALTKQLQSPEKMVIIFKRIIKEASEAEKLQKKLSRSCACESC